LLRAGLVLVSFVLLCCRAEPASALPVFAHRYGLTCQACHTTVPRLNAFGAAFRANGFRMPELRNGSAVPVAVKTQLAYSSDADEGLPKAVVDEVELLTGGAIGAHFNYFIEDYAIDGGRPGQMRDAWLQYNNGNAHIRAGQFTLPLPVDPESLRDSLSHYLVYDQTVGHNPFQFFDPRIGLDVYAQNAGGGVEAHLAAVESYDRQSGNPNSGIDLMAYASKSFTRGITLYAYRYQGQRVLSGARDAFFRQGYGAGKTIGKFQALGVLQTGRDSDAAGDGNASSSSGGFLQGQYQFSDALMAVARYDRVSDGVTGSQHQIVLSLVTRPAPNMRFTIEDQITDHHTLNLGWLFAY
jgi:hypothetical protein